MNRWTRLWFWGLALVDRWLGTNLLERELARRQAALAAIEAEVAELEQTLAQVNLELDHLELVVCLAWLYQRSIQFGSDWSRFDPRRGGEEEEVLDMAIQRLVRTGLAAVRTEEVEPGHYIYTLRPHWGPIRQEMERYPGAMDELIAWVAQQEAGASKAQGEGE